MAKSDAPEREFDHFSIVPFKAICGADRPNQSTSQTPERVKCPICWQYWKEWEASRRFQVAQPAEDERVRLVTMFTELYNCYTASKCHASDEGNREEFLRLKGMAEAYQDAARRIAEPLSIQPILGDKRVGEIRSRTPISDRYTTIGPTETQPCKSVDKHGTHTMCYHIHQYLEQADEDRRHLLSLLPVQPAATPTERKREIFDAGFAKPAASTEGQNERCPFCDGSEIVSCGDDGLYWKRCVTCGATGPETTKYSGEEGELYLDWNSRKGEARRSCLKT